MTASSCSSVESETPKPQIKTVYLDPVIPPAAEIECQLTTVPRDQALTDKQTQDLWNKDRTEIKVCNVRRRLAVSAAKAPASGSPE
ncbi:hypothetical protein [Rhizobium halophytocola]|uniref:Uncharacterized protein n=1 Tax=Rhizobium halophytocola TaxID=735519 RepID=A0ABS4E431_9HYPH|nr:hypothetical protein [Rhizobium halophytocola]MBP1852700.1 hypothetical protein [Rhizobium halophytocola]